VKYVAIVGENEIENEIIQLKNMETGEQEEVSVEELIMKIRG
jgi:histidyl-tRNA synthetase